MLFSYLDKRLILCARWMSRQVELLTPLNYHVFFGTLYLVSAAIGMWLGVRFVFALFHMHKPYLLVFHLAACSLFWVKYQEIFCARQVRRPAWTTWKERQSARLATGMVLFMLLALGGYIMKSFPGDRILFQWVLLMDIVAGSLCVLEYTLCVDPVSEEERERRQLGS